MGPAETQRQNEGPRRRDAASARGSASTERDEVSASGGSPSASAGGATSARASGSQDGSQDHEEAIRLRAYEIYVARGDAPGSDVDDWFAAEREVRSARRERAD